MKGRWGEEEMGGRGIKRNIVYLIVLLLKIIL